MISMFPMIWMPSTIPMLPMFPARRRLGVERRETR
jgi:hypothetical protein